MSDTASTSPPPLRETLGQVLGRTPSGVFLLTCIDGQGRETGMLASWVQQASFDPPMLSVALNRKRYLHDWLAAVPRMALNLLGESHGRFLKHFGRGFEPDEPAFEGLAVTRTESGLPVLSEALGCLEGAVVSVTGAGDHLLYLVEITGAAAHADLAGGKPMVHIRKSGFNY
ncbi:MAG TPA: flavin reductase family protein [Planctomycetaceae bacterium]|nr:flavin reductase family protein [Planctomycetaceae bacterium]